MATQEIAAPRNDAKEFQASPVRRLKGKDYLCTPQPPRPTCSGGGPCRPAPCRPNCAGQTNK